MEYLWIPGLIIAVLLGTYLYHENYTLSVSRYDVDSARIHSRLKIVHLSDFHNATNGKLISAIINAIEEEKPDIAVITGDLLDSRRTSVRAVERFMERMSACCSRICYVPGNHESRMPEDFEELIKVLNSLGVHVLLDDRMELNHAGDIIRITGVKDPNFISLKHYEEEFEEVVRSLSVDDDSLSILLSHRPELLDIYSRYDYDLVFSGHAHGGQIIAPLLGALYAPHQGLLPKKTDGLHRQKKTVLCVSRGLGNSLAPFRINNRPELIFMNVNPLS